MGENEIGKLNCTHILNTCDTFQQVILSIIYTIVLIVFIEYFVLGARSVFQRLICKLIYLT